MPAKEKEEEDVYKKILGMSLEQAAKGYPIEKLGLLTTEKSGSTVYNLVLENVYRILSNHPDFRDKFRYDKWVGMDQILDWRDWRDIDDGDFLEIQSKISVLYPQFRSITKNLCTDGAFLACRRNSVDTFEDKLRAVEWDKTPRIDTWLSTVYGVENNAYHSAVGSNWLKGLVLRVVRPGSQFDSVLLLKGKQGCGKSTSLKELGGDLHAETTMRADNKDFLMLFRGKAIIEFSEGHTLSSSETQQMKSIISTRSDRYRDPYARMMKDRPRRCVFAITTNQERPLKDETGNRRYFPVEVQAEFADINWIKENRWQMFAEALYRIEELKEKVYEFPKEAEAIQEQNIEESPYEEKISDWMKEPKLYDRHNGSNVKVDLSEGVLLTDIWESVLGGSASRMDWRNVRNMGQAMKACGFERRRAMVEGARNWRWFPLNKG